MKRLPRDSLASLMPPSTPVEVQQLRLVFDRPGITAVYLFGSLAQDSMHPLSDVDLAYLGTDSDTEHQLYDPLYEALQRLLGEGNFDLVPLRCAPLHLQFHITIEGTPLLVHDPIAAEDFAAGAIVRYLDFKPYRDAYFAAGE